MDSDEDDMPPMLVGVGGEKIEIEEQAPVKVPITIVTGKSGPRALDSCDQALIKANLNRISRSWKDYTPQLHPE